MSAHSASGRHRVVIVGGGFGGLNAAQALRKADDVNVTLIDRRNFHLFQPLLYQVATGALSPANIASPLRGVLNRQKNTEVILAEVVGFDIPRQTIRLADGGVVPYDSLIVAAGSTHSYFGHDEWSALAPGLKTIEDATEIRRRVLFAFEHAEREADPAVRRAWMTFVVVGAGPTGVELAGALSEIARHTLKHDFRHIIPAETRVILVDASDRVLSAYPPDLSARAARDLASLHIDVRSHTLVTNLEEGRVTIKRGDHEETLEAWTVLWAAGVQASPLARDLAEACGVEVDRAGRITVNRDCTVPGCPNIFAIGDMAQHLDENGKPLPGVAQVAMQQAGYAARVIRNRINGHTPPGPFEYHDLGMIATIGRSKAVAKIGRWKFQGFIAWLMWLFVHLMQLVQFESRLLVFFQWAWSYLTFSRSARLITGKILPLKVRVAHIGHDESIGDSESSKPDEPATSHPTEEPSVPTTVK